MKLVHPDLGSAIVFAENQVNVVTVENKSFFTKLLQGLLLQCAGEDGCFVLSEDNRELEIAEACDLIIDPFSLDINNKKILNKVFSILKSTAVGENHYLETNAFKSALYSYLDSLLFSCDIPLKYQENFDIQHIFRALDIRIENFYSNLLEKLMDYIAAEAELLGTKCFIFVNLKQFLSYAELAELYKFAYYAKVYLLLLEGTFTESRHESEKQYIIDNDLCEIY